MNPNKRKKMTREEKLEKKRLAEKARYQKIKNDPIKYAEQREKEKKKYQSKKDKGIIKLITEMTPREKREVRKKWKQRSLAYRKRRTALKMTTNRHIQQTSPSDSDVENKPPAAAVANAKSAAAKKKSENMRKLRNKIIKRKNQEIVELKRALEKYKKRLTRAKGKTILTPATKVQKMLGNPKCRDTVKRTLLFGEVMKEQIAEKFGSLKSRNESTVFSRVLVGKNVRKYKLLEEVGLSKKRLITASKAQNILDLHRKIRKDQVSKHLKNTVIEFLEDDSNTRMCAGKKEFITKNKERKQKRFLQDTMRNLHKRFIRSRGIDIPYSTFCKCKPFWILSPKVADRNTCLCIAHSNFDYMLEILNRSNITSSSCHQQLLEELCCNRYDENCLSRKCNQCKSRHVTYKEFSNSMNLKLMQWVFVSEEIIDPKTQKARKIRKYTKQTSTVAPRDVIIMLEKKMDEFFQHELNIVHQYKSIKTLKSNLTESDCLIHMDFSENYSTKYGKEIQAYHFGGSRTQISLHTVVTYTKDNTTDGVVSNCYCTMSTNLAHSPAAIWAHMMPILKTLPPKITNLHFLSDGPVTQYRNKTMFYLLAHELKCFFPRLIKFTWNYHEAGHGKGAPDGVGAVCKRTADQVVARGGDVTSLQILADVVQKNCPGITIMVIENHQIEEMERFVAEKTSKLVQFKGTLKVHQVEGNIFLKNTILMKSLSCFCHKDVCEHFSLGRISYKDNERVALQVEEVYSESDVENEHNNDVIGDDLQEKKNIEEPVAGCSKPQSLFKSGDYVLVKLLARKREYRYVAVCEEIDDDEEVKVTFLKVCDEDATLFEVTQEDFAFVSLNQIVTVLPAPSIVLRGNRVYYKFKTSVDVLEK